jgi:hypothetical protein
LRPDYDPMRHPVSLLSLGDAGWVQVAIFIVTGTLLLQRISIVAGLIWMIALAAGLLSGAIDQPALSPAPAARR